MIIPPSVKALTDIPDYSLIWNSEKKTFSSVHHVTINLDVVNNDKDFDDIWRKNKTRGLYYVPKGEVECSATLVHYKNSNYELVTKSPPSSPESHAQGIMIIEPPVQERYIPKSFSGMLECIIQREDETPKTKKNEDAKEIEKCRENIEEIRMNMIRSRKEESKALKSDGIERAAEFLSKKGNWNSTYGDLMPPSIIMSDCWPANYRLNILQPDPRKSGESMSIILSHSDSVSDPRKEIIISYDGHSHYDGVGKNGERICTKADGDCFIEALKIGCPEEFKLKTMDVESIRTAMANALRNNPDLFTQSSEALKPVSSDRQFSSLLPSPEIESVPSRTRTVVPKSAFRTGLTPKMTELTTRPGGADAFMADDIRAQTREKKKVSPWAESQPKKRPVVDTRDLEMRLQSLKTDKGGSESGFLKKKKNDREDSADKKNKKDEPAVTVVE